MLLLLAAACTEARAPDAEIVDQFFDDFNLLKKSCDLSNVAFDPLVEGVYRNGQLPERNQTVYFFSFGEISGAQEKCVKSFRGAHGYTFGIIRYDPALHSDA